MISYKGAKITVFCLLSILIIYGCGQRELDLKEGVWRGIFSVPGGEIPFNFELSRNKDQLFITLINADERFLVDEIWIENDSIHIKLPVYENEIRAALTGDTLMTGVFRKLAGKDPVEIPFKAEFNHTFRFHPGPFAAETDFSGRWKASFTRKDGSIREAIGLFEQKDRMIRGTFLTASGDYRYLEGVVYADNILLSAFDGNNVFFFQARQMPDGSIAGEFLSGASSRESWVAIKDNNFQLPNPDNISKEVENVTPEFDLVSIDGKQIRLSDYQGKVVILQILGSWCPNCLDETRYLVDWYGRNKSKDVEIIGLAFEKTQDPVIAEKRIRRLIDRFGVTYPIAFAGELGNETSDKVLFFITPLKAYPTSIFIDKKGKVRKVHTGFNGPGTGIYFEDHKIAFDQFVNELINEN